ncbi:tRNA/rRNA methyltransferase YsgA [Diplonema papillatum]|nr:tRNA/rRNA methyltransferase YsgA [Diplonema papillatum]|eukprot:gene17795-27410_t
MFRTRLLLKRPSYRQEMASSKENQAGKLKFLEHKGWQHKQRISDKHQVMGKRAHTGEDGFEYYGGGTKPFAKEESQNAQAWRDLHKDNITAIKSPNLDYASAMPMVRSKKTQAAINWDTVMEEMPVAETQVSSRKNKIIQHLIRLRTNPKYRWKQERFVLRSPEAIGNLAKIGYRPELLLLSPTGERPQNINLDETPTVFADKYVVAAACGEGNDCSMAAEYFIPQEESKAMLWHEKAQPLKRVAVMMGITEPDHLGQLIRSAVGMGCDAVLLAEGCADPYSSEVLDASLAAQVTAGGYPKFHILREEEGDDPWGIVNRMLRRHGMQPVLAATLPEDVDSSVTTDALWRELDEQGTTDAAFCIFFGSSKKGLDVDYVKYNLELAAHQVYVPTASVLGLSHTAQAAIIMHSLMEPTYVAPVAPPEQKHHREGFAPIRMITPLTREIEEAKAEGRELELVPVRQPTMRLSKFYKQRTFGKPAYKTEVTLS